MFESAPIIVHFDPKFKILSIMTTKPIIHYSIGIDPSINSTGICVSDGKTNIYYIITSKITKKSVKYCKDKPYIHVIEYDKKDTKGINIYWQKEKVKDSNIEKVIEEIRKIISHYGEAGVIDRIVMEGVSYGSVKGAALVDLSFLNARIRSLLSGFNYYIVAPTEVKKYSVGNGAADKSVMILSWKKLDKNMSSLPEWFKCDDIADAYFMCHYNPLDF